MKQTIWHGDLAEGAALTEAIAHNCGCKFGFMNARISTCTPHQAMVEDQQFLDTLLFMRRIRDKLDAEEQSR